MPTRVRAVLLCCLGALPAHAAYAAQDAEALINLGLTNTWVRFSAIAIFVLAYTLRAGLYICGDGGAHPPALVQAGDDRCRVSLNWPRRSFTRASGILGQMSPWAPFLRSLTTSNHASSRSNEPVDGPWPMVADHSDRGSHRAHAFCRLGRGCRADGPKSRHAYVFKPAQVELGHRARLLFAHRNPSLLEPQPFQQRVVALKTPC